MRCSPVSSHRLVNENNTPPWKIFPKTSTFIEQDVRQWSLSRYNSWFLANISTHEWRVIDDRTSVCICGSVASGMPFERECTWSMRVATCGDFIHVWIKNAYVWNLWLRSKKVSFRLSKNRFRTLCSDENRSTLFSIVWYIECNCY